MKRKINSTDFAANVFQIRSSFFILHRKRRGKSVPPVIYIAKSAPAVKVLSWRDVTSVRQAFATLLKTRAFHKNNFQFQFESLVFGSSNAWVHNIVLNA
ncbi:MAG: hypothetical protein ACYTGS_03255 [Planctomycetota bacterium]